MGEDAMFKEMFDCIDSNHDGKLTFDEINEAYMKASSNPTGKAELAWKDWGKEKDDSISSEEFVSRFKEAPRPLCLLAMFFLMDKNHDKRATLDELIAFGTRMIGQKASEWAQEQLDEQDTDHKGWLVLEDIEKGVD